MTHPYYRHLPTAARSAFRVLGRPRPAWRRRLAEVTVVGRRRSGPPLSFRSTVENRFAQDRPLPPDRLIFRVTGTSDRELFRRMGLHAARELVARVDRHVPGKAPRVLDWGCGCGRVARYIGMLRPRYVLSGCDIDEEAVHWCSAHLPGRSFLPIKPWPPTPFADQAFDAVLGCSVMTKLSAEDQSAWLAEIRRILAPGGILAASVFGSFAASALEPRELKYLLALKGIVDHYRDETLEGVAPPGYYRNVFQTDEYTRARWTRGFEILEYAPSVLGEGLQDLVVLRKTGASRQKSN